MSCYTFYTQGDITRQGDVDEASKGVDFVFHSASYGMSGREQVTEQ